MEKPLGKSHDVHIFICLCDNDIANFNWRGFLLTCVHPMSGSPTVRIPRRDLGRLSFWKWWSNTPTTSFVLKLWIGVAIGFAKLSKLVNWQSSLPNWWIVVLIVKLSSYLSFPAFLCILPLGTPNVEWFMPSLQRMKVWLIDSQTSKPRQRVVISPDLSDPRLIQVFFLKLQHSK